MTVKKARRVENWPGDERLGKRLIAHGHASLSNAQLIATIIKKGKGGRIALDLAIALLVELNSPDNGMIGRMP